jgi:DNA-binding NtrC family response regulator
MSAKILIVDDDPDIVAGLQKRLQWLGYATITAQDGAQALELIEREHLALVLLDLELPTMSGVNVLKTLVAKNHNQGKPPSLSPQGSSNSYPPVIILTAYGTIERAVEVMKLGAYDFLTKPFDPDYLGILVGKALEREVLRREVKYLRAEVESRYATIVADSTVMKGILDDAHRTAASDVVVLLLGETGTGKELLARAIHRWSPRRAGPFMVVNCVALPESLLENELFGHEKGAFTGATRVHEGKIEAADGGTIFLDEIGDMPLSLQSRLLRLLQDREFHRVGGTQNIRVDVRFIAATNKDPALLVTEGKFRQDLFYRLNVVPIRIPPLRERQEDIPALAKLVLEREATRTGGVVKWLNAEASEAMRWYLWPGNVRELENILARAVVLSTQDEIGPQQLGLPLPSMRGHPEKPPTPLPSHEAMQDTSPEGVSYHEAMLAHSRWLLLEALRRNEWNQTKAAAYLKLQRTYFTKLLKGKRIPTKPPEH